MWKYGRIRLVGGILGLVAIFFATGLHQYVSLDNIKEQQSLLQAVYEQRPAMVLAAFSATYIPMIALNLPGAVVLGLAAGALFGALAGTIIVSFASSIGATLACLLSRYLLRDWVQRRFHEKLKRVNAGIKDQGPFYLFALRLMPVIPFFMINLVMGLTSMQLWTFYWVSQLGMLPGTVLFVNAGSQIGRIDSLSGILSPGLIASLALLGIFPLIVRRALGPIRKRYRRRADSEKLPAKISSGSILTALQRDIAEHCSECDACRKSCTFLRQYGTPKSIVKDFDFSSSEGQALAYQCSLCGLCTAICPEKLDPAALFLQVRRRCVEDGNFDVSAYRTILGYEKRGASLLFSWYGLPNGCDTIFFPGCTLPGTRPTVTTELYRQLQEIIPTVGLVLDCCAKPSHDLGRTAGFHDLFDKLHNSLTSQGIRTVLTACPNCTKMFRQYGHGLNVRTVYQIISVKENGNPTLGPVAENAITVHDPCPLRDDLPTQQAVRKMLTDMGHTLVEMKHRGKRTLCCGEGGMVGAINPGFAKAWSTMRGKEAGGQKIVTYCAGCTGYLNRVVPTIHIVDLLYRPEVTLSGNLKIARAPLTYWHRLRLKQRMKKKFGPKVSVQTLTEQTD